MLFGEKKNKLSGAEKVPEQAKSLLPKKGIVLIGGGLMSAGSRAVVDIERKVLSFGKNNGANSTPYGKLPDEGSMAITDADFEKIINLANRIWESEDSFYNMPPIADFNAIIILADGQEIKMINSYGPPVGVVDELYSFIWKLVRGG